MNTIINNSHWQPTSLIRWKRISLSDISYNKVLQQLWRNNLGEEKWIDVPVEKD